MTEKKQGSTTEQDDESNDSSESNELAVESVDFPMSSNRKFVAYTVKLPAEQLAALQSIWLELKRLYGANSPDKSGMIQHAITDWLKRWMDRIGKSYCKIFSRSGRTPDDGSTARRFDTG